MLDHFLVAQKRDFDVACGQLRRGRKTSHWIWYIFPILLGLRSSEMSRRFALTDLDHAVAYLSHPLLRERLVQATRIVRDKLYVDHADVNVLMGSSTDAVKLVSCMTLFEVTARDPRAPDPDLATMAKEVLAAVGPRLSRCDFTLRALGLRK